MIEETGGKTSRVLNLWQRIRNPLEWDSTGRCIFLIVFFSPFLAGYTFRLLYLVNHPEVEPYLNRETMRWMLPLNTAACAVFALLLLSAIYLSRKGRESALLIYGTVQFFFAVMAAMCYVYGPTTSPIVVVPFFFIIFTMLLFERRPALWGTATFFSLWALSAVLEKRGILPTAPFFAGPPYDGHKPAEPYFSATTAMGIFVGILVTLVFHYTVMRWRDREEKLAEAHLLLRAQKDQLVRSESLAAVGSLVTGAAHELRNPLGASGGMLQSLREELAASTELSEASKKELLDSLDQALRGQRRATTIAERLYRLTDQLETHKSSLSLGDGLAALQKQYPTVQFEIPRELDDLEVGQSFLESILPNLLENALAAGGSTPPRVALRLEGSSLVASVSDTGRGIPKAIRGEVFKPFFTGQKTGEGHGVGLGLYIVHELVTRLGGEITLESEERRGTCVTLHLPVEA